MGSMRRASLGAVFFVCAIVIASPLPAQTYPDHPIKLIVPSAPGGPTDIPARITAGFIPKLGQPGVVENRPGAGGALGARSVASSPPDGYTLLVGNTSVFAVNPAVSTSAGYDPLKDFAPVAKFSESFQILVVDPSLRVTSVKELLDYIKANPGKLNYAHTGVGGLPHLTAELFIARTGANIVGVPYRSGGEAVTAVLGQNVQMTFEAISILLPLIREGKVRALAVTSPARTPLAPDLPTMMEAGVPNYEVTTFNGIAAPAGTPAPIIGKLNAAINEGLLTAATKETLAKLGAVASPGSPEDFAAFIAAELAKWRSVAQKANVKID
ncbi:MAG TPA: tripartite tricarboxylate transporter substrate binding protein [Xanthobacteraceae bacterium]|nr:tripartite tricarboxylate transporter substrate binding protein [Xanthobacteraceae bacterium]